MTFHLTCVNIIFKFGSGCCVATFWEIADHSVDHIFSLHFSDFYEGHSRINDNGFISRKVLLYSVLFIMPHEDTDITYSCLKFGAFIMARFNAMII